MGLCIYWAIYQWSIIIDKVSKTVLRTLKGFKLMATGLKEEMEHKKKSFHNNDIVRYS